jgi:hypothetical protein
MEPIEARTKSLRTINTFFRALEVAQGLVNSPQVDGGLRVIAGLDLRRAELLAGAQGALMHGLSGKAGSHSSVRKVYSGFSHRLSERRMLG